MCYILFSQHVRSFMVSYSMLTITNSPKDKWFASTNTDFRKSGLWTGAYLENGELFKKIAVAKV